MSGIVKTWISLASNSCQHKEQDNGTVAGSCGKFKQTARHTGQKSPLCCNLLFVCMLQSESSVKYTHFVLDLNFTMYRGIVSPDLIDEIEKLHT